MRYVVNHLLTVICGINIGALLMSQCLYYLDSVVSFLSQIFGERFSMWLMSFDTYAEALLFLAQYVSTGIVLASAVLYVILWLFSVLAEHW